MAGSTVLVDNLERTRDWTLKLIADLNGDDWIFQPVGGVAHAQWICGHLAVAQHLLVHVRCLGATALPDDFVDHFPIGAPIRSATEYEFPAVENVLATMEHTHRKTVAVVAEMSDDLLLEPAFGPDGAVHPHYRNKQGAVLHCARHEAFHAGQIATIRRLLGKSFLR